MGQGASEIARIKADLVARAARSEQSGSWLAAAMEASRDVAEALLSFPQFADARRDRYLFSAAELINHAADLSAASSVLTHEDERRWRIFRKRLERITSAGPG